MRLIFLSLMFLFFQSENKHRNIFFDIDDSIKMEDVSFGKQEIDRWNRIIKVKGSDNLKLKIKIENKDYQFSFFKWSVYRLNTISVEKIIDSTNTTLQIFRDHTIVSSANKKDEKTDFKLKIKCFSEVLQENEILTQSKKFNTYLKENVDFFF